LPGVFSSGAAGSLGYQAAVEPVGSAVGAVKDAATAVKNRYKQYDPSATHKTPPSPWKAMTPEELERRRHALQPGSAARHRQPAPGHRVAQGRRHPDHAGRHRQSGARHRLRLRGQGRSRVGKMTLRMTVPRFALLAQTKEIRDDTRVVRSAPGCSHRSPLAR
jgi:hypothetical protein